MYVNCLEDGVAALRSAADSISSRVSAYSARNWSGRKESRCCVSSLFKIVVLIVVVYSVATASSERQAAMYDGTRAFVGSIGDACIRTWPCSEAIRSIRQAFGETPFRRDTSLRLPERHSESPVLER